jgi:hypothetical protein
MDQDGRFTVGNVDVFPDPQDTCLYYIAPHHVRVGISAAGLPSMTLLFFGDKASLMLETLWFVGDDERTQLSAAIAEHWPQRCPHAADVRMVPPPVRNTTANLLLVDPDGTEQQLASTGVNPMGSLHATFAAGLSAADGQCLLKYLNDPAADVIVRYTIVAYPPWPTFHPACSLAGALATYPLERFVVGLSSSASDE